MSNARRGFAGVESSALADDDRDSRAVTVAAVLKSDVERGRMVMVSSVSLRVEAGREKASRALTLSQRSTER
jgi:hypothetical protein